MTDQELQKEYKRIRKICKKEKGYAKSGKSQHYLAWAIIVHFSMKRGVFSDMDFSEFNATGMVLKAIDQGTKNNTEEL